MNGGFFVDKVKWEVSARGRFESNRQETDSVLQSHCCFATGGSEKSSVVLRLVSPRAFCPWAGGWPGAVTLASAGQASRLPLGGSCVSAEASVCISGEFQCSD